MLEEQLMSEAPERLHEKEEITEKLLLNPPSVPEKRKITRKKFVQVSVATLLTTILSLAIGNNPWGKSPGDSLSFKATAEAGQEENQKPKEDFEKSKRNEETLSEKPKVIIEDERENKKDQQQEKRRTKEKETFFEALISPFLQEADLKREERRKNNPESLERINPKLSRLYTFSLFGYGETYEPPLITKPGVIIGSYTIVYYDTKTKTLGKVSLSHDFHSPEVAKKRFNNQSAINPQTRISEAYLLSEEKGGGFNLTREVLEDATGLSIDYQLAFSDEQIQKAVDDVFGTVEVDVENSARVDQIFFKNKAYPAKDFPKGKTKMNGLDAIQYIKGVPIPRYPNDYQRELEHHVRETAVIRGIKNTFLNKLFNLSDPLFSFKLTSFLTNLSRSSGRESGFEDDFDFQKLVVDNSSKIVQRFVGAALQINKETLQIPEFKKEMYFADDRSGSEKGVSQRDERGNMFLPKNANRFGDPVKDYWRSTRDYLEKVLLE